MLMGSLSPRMVALNHTLDSLAMVTLPITDALGAM
jgi:hypothetical protein